MFTTRKKWCRGIYSPPFWLVTVTHTCTGDILERRDINVDNIDVEEMEKELRDIIRKRLTNQLLSV